MANYALIERVLARIQMARAVRRLGSKSPVLIAQATEELRSAGERSHALLLNLAFRERSPAAVRAAALLYSMGEKQGLYALLDQFYNQGMAIWYGNMLKLELERIGEKQIIHCLEEALDYEMLANRSWGPALGIFALHAIDQLKILLPETLWLRALTVYCPGYEDLRVCRTLLPVGWSTRSLRANEALYTKNMRSEVTLATLAQIRRQAVDILLHRRPGSLYLLLHKVIAHEAPEVQLTAVYGFWRLGDSRACLVLQPIAANRRHPIARDARRAIESFGERLPEALTLVRASGPAVRENQLLRPAATYEQVPPEFLLRPPSQDLDL